MPSPPEQERLFCNRFTAPRIYWQCGALAETDDGPQPLSAGTARGVKSRVLRLHGVLYSVLIALVNNVDNISVRIAYSIKGIKLGLLSNLWISVITFLISTAAAAMGSLFLNAAGQEICKIISMAILCVIGLWFIAEPFVKRKPAKRNNAEGSVLCALSDPEKSDLDDSKNIDFKEATLLGVSLSINNVGGCLSAGIMGLGPVLIGLLSAAVSFAALWAGNFLTDIFVRLSLKRKASVTAGAILILIGIKQLF